jgi:hypothetical protein
MRLEDLAAKIKAKEKMSPLEKIRFFQIKVSRAVFEREIKLLGIDRAEIKRLHRNGKLNKEQVPLRRRSAIQGENKGLTIYNAYSVVDLNKDGEA